MGDEDFPKDAPIEKVAAFKEFIEKTKRESGARFGLSDDNWQEDFETLRNHPKHLNLNFASTIADLPPSVDLSGLCSPIAQQWLLESCTAFAGIGLVEFLLKKAGRQDFKQSELFLYYNERLMEGTLGKNTGAHESTIIKALHEYGSCPESLLPYNLWDRWHINNKPSKECYDAAKELTDLDDFAHTIVEQDLEVMKRLLAEGQPFLLGIKLYKSTMSWRVFWTGDVPMPDLNPNSGDTHEGGHSIMIVGYDDKTERFKIRNSWGTWWGNKGYGTIPYAFLTNPKLAHGIFTMYRLGPAVQSSIQ